MFFLVLLDLSDTVADISPCCCVRDMNRFCFL